MIAKKPDELRWLELLLEAEAHGRATAALVEASTGDVDVASGTRGGSA